MTDFSLIDLRQQPGETCSSYWGKVPITMKLGIQNYRSNLENQYRKDFSSLSFEHFGLILTFQTPTQLQLHDSDMQLIPGIAKLLEEFGPVILRNASLPDRLADIGHRNRFPHLRFHRDRNSGQPTPISLFYRNPTDAEQRFPRTSSTLLISNEHARLELERTGNGIDAKTDLSHCMLFTDQPSHQLRQEQFSTLILEQPWDEPEGTGEICIQDNRKLLHASFYRNAQQDGYRIGVRYCSL